MKFEIKTEDELNAVWDAIRTYRLKHESNKKKLAGTHWKKIRYNADGSLYATDYFIVVPKEINKRYMLVMSIYADGDYHISSFARMHHLNAVDDEREKLVFISEKTYREQTSKILLKYGLKWI